ncbi:unnamed protein product [Tetraodon nigroviridis]|uniref:(spotted green pufferfish) hypothetical protein n=1 Tax=Tetraodon nigroviridis TaxID=99883 RepID=Q4T9X6_TETNG|nr:unnamed protein product [Tetraodon nigroviridis]
MATQREKDAAEYLQKHRIMELLENLSSLMFYHRPEDPRAFLAAQRSGGPAPSLFGSDDLDALFGMLDPTGQNYITVAQYKQAVRTLGIQEVNQRPDGFNEDRISPESFKAEAMEGLRRRSATYQQ